MNGTSALKKSFTKTRRFLTPFPFLMKEYSSPEEELRSKPLLPGIVKAGLLSASWHLVVVKPEATRIEPIAIGG